MNDESQGMPCSIDPPHSPFVGKPNEPIEYADHEIPKRITERERA